jgi:hypothetical protein
VWYGHEYVFFAAAVLALVMLFFANMIHVGKEGG